MIEKNLFKQIYSSAFAGNDQSIAYILFIDLGDLIINFASLTDALIGERLPQYPGVGFYEESNQPATAHLLHRIRNLGFLGDLPLPNFKAGFLKGCAQRFFGERIIDSWMSINNCHNVCGCFLQKDGFIDTHDTTRF